MHAKLGVKASDDTHDHFCQPENHDVQQFTANEELETLVSQSDVFDEPATQEGFMTQVRDQLIHCAQARGTVVELSEDDYVTTHSPVLALDLVPHRRPNVNPKPGGHLECNVSSSSLID